MDTLLVRLQLGDFGSCGAFFNHSSFLTVSCSCCNEYFVELKYFNPVTQAFLSSLMKRADNLDPLRVSI
ncbi:hypothetical protein CW304_30980 [Bacillus sp. UFRGS-B20]|nr:hypothetical protein CW304_30980 [Bacillus sp. UFRGS-B20]